MDKEEFISTAEKIYGQQYDYHCVSDEDVKYPASNVPIICLWHGLFHQSVYDHLEGKGCFECYKEKFWNNKNERQ